MDEAMQKQSDVGDLGGFPPPCLWLPPGRTTSRGLESDLDRGQGI